MLSVAIGFFKELGIKDVVEFLDNIKREQYKEAIEFILKDIVFAIRMTNTLKSFPVLRRELISKLPDSEEIPKDKLLFLLYSDEKDYNSAFELLKTMVFQDMNYFECIRSLEVASIKHAWDFEVILIKKLLRFESNDRSKLGLRVQLMNAYDNLGMYVDGVGIGEEILANEIQMNYLDIILTEDRLYLQANSLETNKNIPEYTSTFVLIRELYMQNRITIDDYLGFFSYLASYRFRFLTINSDDIEHAIFGVEGVQRFTPEKFKLFHPWLTLSPDYGVPFENAFFIVARVLYKALINLRISASDTVRLFTEIIDDFPTDKGKNTLGRMLIMVCLMSINNRQTKVDEEAIQHKIEALNKIINDGLLQNM